MNFTSLQTIGVIVIGIILLLIVLAFIFSSKFRKDVIAGEGEAAVLGLINVKGVIIVLLAAIFGGVFVYLIQMDSKNITEANDNPKTVDLAIEILSNTDKDKFELIYNPDVVLVKVNGQKIGEVARTEERLRNKKRNDKDVIWDVVSKTKGTIGYYKLDYNLACLDFSPKNDNSMLNTKATNNTANKQSTGLMFQTNHQLDNSKLVFRIDSVSIKGTSRYWIKFGEGSIDNEENIAWREEYIKYHKSANANIGKTNQYKCLTAPNWSKLYFVGVGLGDPGHDGDHQLNHVDLAKIVVLEASFE